MGLRCSHGIVEISNCCNGGDVGTEGVGGTTVANKAYSGWMVKSPTNYC